MALMMWLAPEALEEDEDCDAVTPVTVMVTGWPTAASCVWMWLCKVVAMVLLPSVDMIVLAVTEEEGGTVMV